MKSQAHRLVTLPRNPVALGLVAFVAFAVALELYYLFFALAYDADPVATFFPPAGLSVALFLGAPYVRWPVLVAAIWAAGVTVDTANGVGFGDAALWGMANTVEPMVGAALIRQLIPPADRHSLTSTRNLMAFLGSAVLAGPFAGSLIAMTAAPAGDRADLLGFWIRWWVGNGIGVLVVTPVLLVLGNRRQSDQSIDLPLLGLVAFVSALSLGTVGPLEEGRGVYLILPTLVWVAFKGGPRTTALAVLIVGLSVNVVTLSNEGPFVEPGSPHVGQVNAQVFVGTVAFSALFVAVLGANLIRRDKVELILRDQARTDPLTGIGNRRMLFERLDEMRATGRLGARDRIAFLVLDLDGFKQVNDTWGHTAGDRVLETTANRLVTATREKEIVVRLGGDEFLVCLTASPSTEEVRAVADRLASLLTQPIKIGTHTAAVGVSIGVADGQWGDFDADEFLRRADEEMYAVKHRRTLDPSEQVEGSHPGARGGS